MWQANAFDGEGANLYGGRWNNKGTPLIYTAASRALAVLELLVNIEFEESLENDFLIYQLEVADNQILTLAQSDLPDDWLQYPASEITKQIGDQWQRSAESLVLEVPSAIIRQESNFLINPQHKDFKKVVIGEPVSYLPDGRMMR